MNLSELSKEYEKSGNLCRARALELRAVLKQGQFTEKEHYLLYRRLASLTAMARDAFLISCQLADYYGRSDADAQR